MSQIRLYTDYKTTSGKESVRRTNRQYISSLLFLRLIRLGQVA